jgi:hypothetical protein
VGEIIDMAEFRERKAARTLAQRQFHPAGTNKKKPNKKGVVGKAKADIDAKLIEMGLNPDDYKD